VDNKLFERDLKAAVQEDQSNSVLSVEPLLKQNVRGGDSFDEPKCPRLLVDNPSVLLLQVLDPSLIHSRQWGKHKARHAPGCGWLDILE